MAELVKSTYPIFTDIDGTPLEDGYIFIGVAGADPEVSPQQAYWDLALTVPADNIRTKSGYPVNSGIPNTLYTAAAYSILVKNKRDIAVYSYKDSFVESTADASSLSGATLSTDGTLSSDSDTLIPTEKAVKTYSDTKVSLSGAESVAGVKTFSSIPIVPTNPIISGATGAVQGGDVYTYAEPKTVYSVHNITTATDEIYALPTAVGSLTEYVIKRRGAGTGKVLFSTQSAQTIDGLAANQFELRGEVEITLFPSGGNWEQKSVVKDWVPVYDNNTNNDHNITQALVDGQYRFLVVNDSGIDARGSSVMQIDRVSESSATTFYCTWSQARSIAYTISTDNLNTGLEDYAIHLIEKWQDRVKLAGL